MKEQAPAWVGGLGWRGARGGGGGGGEIKLHLDLDLLILILKERN